MRDLGQTVTNKKSAKGRKNSYQPVDPDVKKGRKDEDLNGNFVKAKESIPPKSSSNNRRPRDYHLKPWTAPEWVPKDIDTIPRSKVKACGRQVFH